MTNLKRSKLLEDKNKSEFDANEALLFELLDKSDADVSAGRVAPIEGMFDRIREKVKGESVQ